MPSYPWPFTAVTAPNFLSGIFAFTTTPTRPTGLASDVTPIRVKSCWVTNTTNTEQTVTITDGNGVSVVPSLSVPAGVPTRVEELEGEAFTGLKVSSTVNSGVQGQIEGWV